MHVHLRADGSGRRHLLAWGGEAGRASSWREFRGAEDAQHLLDNLSERTNRRDVDHALAAVRQACTTSRWLPGERRRMAAALLDDGWMRVAGGPLRRHSPWPVEFAAASGDLDEPVQSAAPAAAPAAARPVESVRGEQLEAMREAAVVGSPFCET